MPLAGSWRITEPLGTVALFSCAVASTVSPALVSEVTAVSAERPVQSTTSIGSRPLLRTRATLVPRFTEVLASGSVEITWPAGTVSSYASVTGPTCSRWAVSWRWASARLLRTRSGTL